MTQMNDNNILTLTDAAVDHIKSYLKQHQAKAMRLTVKKSGCSGYKYDILAENIINPDDKIFQQEGAIVVISKSDLLYYAGTEIDYIRDGLNKKMVFNNPNAKNSCGCGESFNIKPE